MNRKPVNDSQSFSAAWYIFDKHWEDWDREYESKSCPVIRCGLWQICSALSLWMVLPAKMQGLALDQLHSISSQYAQNYFSLEKKKKIWPKISISSLGQWGYPVGSTRWLRWQWLRITIVASILLFALTIFLIKINGTCKEDREHNNNFGRKKHALIHLFMKDIIWQSSICLFMSQYLFNVMFWLI